MNTTDFNKHKEKVILPLILMVLTGISACQKQQEMKKEYNWPDGVTAPVAEKKEHFRIIHGDTVADPYYWMIDFFKEGPDSAQVIEYLTAENAYLDTMMSGNKQFREDLFKEMKSRIQEKDESVPVFKNGYYYYTRTEEGKQYYKYCRKKGSLDATEEVLADVDAMAEGFAYYQIGGFSISPDNKLMVYGVDTLSRRQYDLYVKNLETGEILPDKISNTSGYGVWAKDNKTFFYTFQNVKTLLTEQIRRHTLGTDSNKDVTVYHEKDNSNYIGVEKSRSGEYIMVISQATMSSEYRFLKADNPTGEFKLFQPRMNDVLYSVEPQEDRFLILTNDHAQNFKLMESPLDKTGKENWKEVIPHRKDVLLSNVDGFKDFLVLSERKNGLVQIRLIDKTSGNDHYLDFGEPTYQAGLGSNPEYDTKTIRYSFSSMITPNSVYDYSVATKEKTLMKQQPVLGGYNPDDYLTERLYIKARDGVSVPVSIVYKKGFNKDGGDPLLLYAYGSYGYSMDAAFSSNRLSLLNRGFAFAIAHIRGGEEMGREWYENGKMMHKKNTFNDFIDCAEELVRLKFTAPKHLYANGGSAGGLLMGAIANMRPDLFNGIIADVPFVDVVNTMLDESIPLTTNEYDEWGNPNNKEAFEYIKSYSPYENIEAKEYPHLLVTTGLHDSQVQYFEPAKWVAKLRATKTGNSLLFLHTNMDFGHGGASGRFEYLKDVALMYAFIFSLEGITQ